MGNLTRICYFWGGGSAMLDFPKFLPLNENHTKIPLVGIVRTLSGTQRHRGPLAEIQRCILGQMKSEAVRARVERWCSPCVWTYGRHRTHRPTQLGVSWCSWPCGCVWVWGWLCVFGCAWGGGCVVASMCRLEFGIERGVVDSKKVGWRLGGSVQVCICIKVFCVG